MLNADDCGDGLPGWVFCLLSYVALEHGSALSANEPETEGTMVDDRVGEE